LVLSRVRLIRVRLVLVNLNPINDTYIRILGSLWGSVFRERTRILSAIQFTTHFTPFPPHQTTSIVKYVRAHLTNTRCSSVTYVTQDGIWTAFSHPLPLFHMDSGNAPYVSHATSFPSQLLSTFAFLPPSSISTLIKMLPKK